MAGGLYELAGTNWYGGLGFEQRNAIGTPMLALQARDVPALSGGYRWDERHSLSLQLVPGGRRERQPQEVHLVYRAAMGRDQISVDLLSSTALLPTGRPAQRLGLAVSYDWPRYFVRLAYDSKADFTPQDRLRLSAGVRF